MRYLNKFLFLAGVFFISILLHELIHYLDCGGQFFAGFWWDGQINLGQTWCIREWKWGEWNSIIEIGFIIYGLFNLKNIV